MTVRRFDHVGIVVDDFAAAKAFFLELGFEVAGEARLEGGWVDGVVGLRGVRSTIAMLRTPSGGTNVELVRFDAPADGGSARPEPANARGIRHLSIEVDDLDATLTRLKPHGAELVGRIEDYEDIYRVCYVRGPEGIILELAQRLRGG